MNDDDDLSLAILSSNKEIVDIQMFGKKVFDISPKKVYPIKIPCSIICLVYDV